MLCIMEGIERYCAQYCEDDPDRLSASEMSDRPNFETPSRTILLGHPQNASTDVVITSSGCAVGIDEGDAALRGLLELIEHRCVSEWRNGAAQDFKPVEIPSDEDELVALTGWLGKIGCQVRFLHAGHACGANMFIAICSDTSGGRPAYGSAIGFEPRNALRHAGVEAFVGWQNLMAIDLRGLGEDELPAIHRDLLTTYRGLTPLPQWNADDRISFGDLEPENAMDKPWDAAALFREIAASTGREVLVYNLSRTIESLQAVRVVFAADLAD